VCQQVCPYNAAAPQRHAADPQLSPADDGRGHPSLLQLLAMGANQTRKWVDGTAMRRASRPMLRRNTCVALGNSGDPTAITPLAAALRGDPHPLVRGHAAWALGRLGARGPLTDALASETDAYVTDEIRSALANLGETSAREQPLP
jgi:epoxyqueuosine reductase